MAQDNQEVLLPIKRLAELSNESLAVWRKRIYRGEIDYYKAGRNVRVRSDDFEAWLRARVVRASGK